MSGCSNIIINYVTNSTYLIWLGVRKKTEKLIKSRKLKKPNCEKKPIKSIKILKKLTFGFISLKLKKPNWTKKKPSQTGKNRVKLVWTGFCHRKPNRIEIGRFEPVSVLDIYIYIYIYISLLYPCKNKNTSLIFRKRTYWESQPRTPNEISFTF